ncbi:MAG: type II glyceraldehyde-3-phosphate dehydrogenase [Thermoprotei archaeon]|nr:type II glyceraldehyde-3-phosphate dehydrogenase [Thermoprotei archaeon]
MVRVGVNGYGTIGKRVALAVLKQEDMSLVGIVKKTPDYAALQARRLGINVYAPTEDDVRKFEDSGVKVGGTLRDLLESVDVIVDATPGGMGEQYRKLYDQFKVKQVFQGGEKPEIAEVSFNSLCNYGEALGRRSARVVSCNTTGLLRIICTLNAHSPVEKVRAVVIRRAADPKEVKRGPVNSIELDPPKAPSHHAKDVKTVIPWVKITTVAVAVPTTLMHVHHVTLKVSKKLAKSDVIAILEAAPRVMLINAERTGITGTAGIVEASRDLRPRYDVPELVVFEDSLNVEDDEISLFQAVHQESIVVPENIDVIRALIPLELDPTKSIEKTDRALELNKKLW